MHILVRLTQEIAETTNSCKVEEEKQRRENIWQDLLARGGPLNASPALLRELGIHGGAAGIWVKQQILAEVCHQYLVLT